MDNIWIWPGRQADGEVYLHVCQWAIGRGGAEFNMYILYTSNVTHMAGTSLIPTYTYRAKQYTHLR